MKNYLLGLLLVTAFACPCAAQTREANAREFPATVNEFLTCLKANDQQKIYDISYHVTARNYITDSVLRRQYVETASKALNQYPISPRSMWWSEKLPDGSSTLTIPLISGIDSADRAEIVLRFPPEAVSNKVYNFNAYFKTDRSGGIVAPQRNN